VQPGAARTRAIVATLAAALAMLAASRFETSAAGPLPSAWTHWHYSRAIELASADAAQLASVVPPLEVYNHAKPGLSDLRVIDDQGTETPYAIFQREETSHTSSLPATLRENSFTPGQFTQLVIDAGPRTPFHNALRIDTLNTDFIEWVQVEASDDGHVWRVVQERAPIFRFQKQNHQGVQIVKYSENNAQYVRVRILDGGKKFWVTGAQVLHETLEPAERVPADSALSLAPNQDGNRTIWSADLGAAGSLVREVRFDVTAPAEFIRSVDVSSSPDGKDWNTLRAAEIYRYRRENAEQEQLSVALPKGFPGSRYIRVKILNGNDAPLTMEVPQLYLTPRHIVFAQRPGRSYFLIYGQEMAKDANYDLERRLDAKQMAAAISGQLGPEEINTSWVDPRPWTETHDVFLWFVLVVAVMMIGYAAVRSLRRSVAGPER
jgi:hypothetical protein